ncbi:MAG: hypothetical protein BHW44_10250 [Roseburia sp. 40_7]|nr:MAG: hypothetical protein BHW44_10250 [Roseburia sp. 40_7]
MFAKYFAAMIFPTDTGEVKINWSVLLFCSSARLRIVRIGTVIKNKNVIAFKEYETFDEP